MLLDTFNKRILSKYLMHFNLRKETKRSIVRSIIIYFGLLTLDFMFIATRGDDSLFKLSSYAPVTLYYLFILFNNRVLIKPFILDSKKYMLYVLCFLPALILFSLLYNWSVPASGDDRALVFVYIILSNAYVAFIGSATYLGWNYFQEKNKFLQLNSLQRETELKQLRLQLNPHFLFNSLNNIYSYNIENNKHGNDLILKLSQLMRYIVESSGKENITLQEELDFISNYIDFEKERSGYRCEVGIKTSIQDQDIPIAPLLFFPLIENAFKYGTSSNENSQIEIDVTQSYHNLKVSITNNIIKEGSKNSLNLGLDNVRRRLELLYPNKHQLNINITETIYHVDLSIQLT
jgi:two-component system, LytTR family, sensor kinase